MDYWNVDVRTIRSGKLADLSLDEVGAWTRVSSFCVDQENQGLIKGARTWSETRWIQTTGVPRKMILRCKELFEWEGDDLRVWMYPVSQEEVCQEKRRIAAAAGVASGIARRKLAEERKAKELELACEKERTAERPFNGNSEVVEQKRKEIEKETGRVKEKESKTETPTLEQAQGHPPTPAKPAGAAPLSVSVCNFSQIQIQSQTTAPQFCACGERCRLAGGVRGVLDQLPAQRRPAEGGAGLAQCEGQGSPAARRAHAGAGTAIQLPGVA